MRPANTWICVADRSCAKFYRYDGPGRDVEPLLNLGFGKTARLPDNEDFTDAVPAGLTGGIVSRIERGADAALFERLVLVAPDFVLGAIRSTLRPDTRRLVVGEIDKDLTRATPRELVTHVRDALPQ